MPLTEDNLRLVVSEKGLSLRRFISASPFAQAWCNPLQPEDRANRNTEIEAFCKPKPTVLNHDEAQITGENSAT